MNWIARYESYMLKRVLPEQGNFSALDYLRSVVFFRAIIYIFPFAFIIIIPGTFFILKTGDQLMAIINLLSHVFIIPLILIKTIPSNIKKIIFTSIMFHLSFQLFFRMENTTFGMMY